LELRSWGNYPKINSRTFSFDRETSLREIILNHNELIPYGNGRSYGDSALNKNIIQVKPYNFFLDFDDKKGVLHAQAGVLLAAILDIFVPKGWFLQITPGTKLITLGGAIASDVHGKNHHREGCFSECVDSFRLMLPDGSVLSCSKSENTELFRATCGGMGLTGVILDARIRLKKIYSANIEQITVKTKNLQETFNAFETHKDKAYSVAWVDCLAKGGKMGKAILTAGDFSTDGDLTYSKKKKFDIPFFLPSFTLNAFSVKFFNQIYYARAKKQISVQKTSIDAFFYPLDALENWNRVYGKNGFIQYQFVLPKASSDEGLLEILKKITASGKTPTLAVLKLCGKANENYLSFPMEGYSLALDFKIEKGLFELLDQLDEIVLKHGGRIYLTKDARTSKETFEKGYPQVSKFREIRNKYNMNDKFESLQSRRIKI